MTAVQSSTRVSWNQGRIVGPKPPLKPKHIWAIRTRLQHDGAFRDLAMFNTAIDSKLRGCDVVKLRVPISTSVTACGCGPPSSSRRLADRCRSSSPSRHGTL